MVFRKFSVKTILFFITASLFVFYNTYTLAAEQSQADNKVASETTDEENDDDDEICPEDAEETDEYDDNEDDSFFSFLDTPQQVISSGVESFAQTMDEFFSEDRVFYNSSGSYLKFTLDTLFNENGSPVVSADFRLKLRLPHTKEKSRLIIESDTDKRTDNKNIESNQKTAKDGSNLFAGFQTTVEKEKSNWGFKPSIGFKLSKRPDLYTKLRLNWQREFNKWSIHWNETAYSFHFAGSGLDSSLEFNRRIYDKNLFRATSLARWTDTNRYFEITQSFSMFHTLSERRAISYYVSSFGISKPVHHATYYLIGANYRQRVHKDYLFFEIIPQVLYQKENDFKSEASLTFRIEMIFKK